jgi:hypothetical protein
VRVLCCLPTLQSAKTKHVEGLLKLHPWAASTALLVHGGDIDPNVFLACRNLHSVDFLPLAVCAGAGSALEGVSHPATHPACAHLQFCALVSQQAAK